jgi:hypothetical protein
MDSSEVSELSASGLWAASRGNHSLNLKISAAGLFQSDVTQARGVGSFLGGFQKSDSVSAGSVRRQLYALRQRHLSAACGEF